MNDTVRATLRLQLHKGFPLDAATEWVPYYARLGISHLYASPLLCARAGSMHGYDVVDPTRVNPELGDEPALRRLVAALREHGMGLILDIVSNHMAVGGADNPWWLDLLEWGRRSPYGEFFDIQWHSPDPLLEGQLLMPFLGSDYGTALQEGTVVLRFDAERGGFHAEHYQHHFPICPRDYGQILADVPELEDLANRFKALNTLPDAYSRARQLRAELAGRTESHAALEASLQRYDAREADGFERLHRLLERQHYRLASWRTAGDDINWRRFFDVNELGGLRVERPAVFEATHQKIFQLISEGLVDGLRIDHVDGLADPRGYCRRLRRRLDALAPGRHLPIYVEKILGQDEQLHRDWQVDGTTGYEFMNQLSLLQHDPRGAEPLASLWSRLTERPAAFGEEARLARQQMLNGSLAGDFESVAQALLQVARDNVMSRDLTLGAIRRALQELIVHFPVYRTYIGACGRPGEDEPFFQQALAGARTTLGEADWPVLDYLQQWLGGEPWRRRPPGRARKLLRHACVRFQQLTSPTAAKAVEDTAFYRSAILLSRNDVGFSSEQFSAPAKAFHQANRQRLATFPDNLLTTATHDHKRGEDARARLAVLSECGSAYAGWIGRWRELAAPLRGAADAPSAGDELMLYQTLLGSWPLDLGVDDAVALGDYAERLAQWQRKALREAKLQSSWSAPNEAYETACHAFLEALLLKPEGLALRQALATAVQAIAPTGALNSLAQCLLRMSVPGLPDLYQGNEFWDFSLVDPDNRRPVDFAARHSALQASATPGELLDDWRSGRIKQALISQTLAVRARHEGLFRRGDYQPLEVCGEYAEKILAFSRGNATQQAIVVVPRLAHDLLAGADRPWVAPAAWGDTRIKLPLAAPHGKLKGLFSTGAVTTDRELMVADALGDFPVNLFTHT